MVKKACEMVGIRIRPHDERVIGMIETHHVHNVNLVTPDHFFPHVFELVSLLRRQGYNLPVVYNLSGYQSVSTLRMAESF